ncbi:glycosyltransferase family 2 protein [Devosia sp. YIM 151766]|uniref:glycosyltransferase family 2 protein n=1 Tax=Devosia sp. YIM 151766 TaxID=3017325 RepID=UPI00255C8071|nr:glycosyltransferase family 2 protein [Devosia sp. YIM 151766]WIY54205.1 glycosyltransferase family 2 protein [Devosia sp. YIM 151766]
MARISVVIPCHNYARYLPAAVDSVLSQEGVSVDIIIVDDASSDESADVATSYMRRDSRVRLIRHEQNAGPVVTFNHGLEYVQGEFLVRLDADDLLTPGSLQRAVAVARRFPSVGLIYGHPLHFSGPMPPRFRDKVAAWTVWRGIDWLADRCRSGFNVITSPEVMMRMSVVERVGGQQPLEHTHDMEMWLRLAAFADVAYIHGADQAWHREHPASLSARKVDNYRDLVERHLAFETLFAGIAGKNPEIARLRESAMEAIARSALHAAIHCYDHGLGSSPAVERYLDVARRVGCPTNLPEWKMLQRRIIVGPERAPRHPAVMIDRIVRRFENASKWRRWHREGIF